MNPLDAPMQQDNYTYVSPGPTILKYGMIGSVIMIIISLITFLLSTKISGTSGVVSSLGTMAVSVAIYLLLMIFSIKEYRDRLSDGYVSLGKGMLVAYGTGLIVAIVNLLFSFLYFFVLDPNYMERMMQAQYDEMGIDPATMRNLSPSVANTGLIISQVSSFVIGCMVGAVLALIVAAVMKKDRPRFA